MIQDFEPGAVKLGDANRPMKFGHALTRNANLRNAHYSLSTMTSSPATAIRHQESLPDRTGRKQGFVKCAWLTTTQ